MAAMARSLADDADNGYSPPTPMPNINRLKLMTGNNVDGFEDRKMLDEVRQIAPTAMSVAVIILPLRLPTLFAMTPSPIIPTMTPNTTEYVID